jgi:hypothetical protein
MKMMNLNISMMKRNLRALKAKEQPKVEARVRKCQI